MWSLCFLEEITDDGVIVDPTEMIDGVVPHDEYRDEMDMMTIIPVPELLEDDNSLFEGSVSPYSPASCDSTSISAPHSPTSHIFDIDDEVAQPNPNRDSSDHDSDLVDEKVSPATRDVENVDFGIEDQPRELKIGSPLSTNERDRLIHLLRSYLDVFAWSYEDMLGLDPSIVQHHLPILPHAKPSDWLMLSLFPKRMAKLEFVLTLEILIKPALKMTFLSHTLICWSDSTAGHSLLSFMDVFSGYNQILMTLEDMEKTTFITEWGTYCYKVMPFGLKNEGALIRGVDHLEALERFFERIRKFRLRLNLKKCTFGVTSGKLLGHMVSERGIEVNLDKIKAILDMPAPKTEKEIRGRPLLLYLSISDMALGCMLAQIDDSWNERAIYYLSKRMLEYEMKYVMIERLCLALVWATRRLRHYMTEYSLHLISCLDPLRYLFDRPALTGRLMRWLVLLTEFDIQYVSQKSIREDGACTSMVQPINQETALELDIKQIEVFGDSNLSAEPICRCLSYPNSSMDIPIDVVVRPLLIELRFAPTYYCLIGETEVQDDLPWYHDIYQFLRFGTYPEVATAKDQRALRHCLLDL
ncbi:Retrovirus-related Pol polyprotein from transposon 17.6 [Vitis vinifera]|uniref:Retrovirus-related Pol polyprotein from transposon 17.6 n=1 Tax=Vitis vinifera TaxID=29760 RepID=A0A438GY90_VITVI|nr:Retrovirus-related Pol polyprotein from transposon 17.6 [Vitis vinifera]